jgi:predicted MFS family arabinose efflux permease
VGADKQVSPMMLLLQKHLSLLLLSTAVGESASIHAALVLFSWHAWGHSWEGGFGWWVAEREKPVKTDMEAAEAVAKATFLVAIAAIDPRAEDDDDSKGRSE